MNSKSNSGLTLCPGSLGELHTDLGFKAGSGGAHSARTMMLADLTALLSKAPAHAKRDDLNRLIVDENCLGKKTTSNRWLTARHLADLYGLDQGVTVFRLLRVFWSADAAARPMLALLCANARDALLRLSAKKVLDTKTGETVTSADFVNFFNHELPGRFSEAMTASLAQNVGATWTHAGFFKGKITKTRTRPVITPAAAAYALILGYLVFGRKLPFLEAARTVESLGRPVNGSFCVRQRPNRRNSPPPATLRLSDLACDFKWGGFQAARRAVAARAHSRASSSRPITCRL